MNLRHAGLRALRFLLLSGLLSTGIFATAVDIYVAPTGNDTTGTGAIGAPYFTINRGLADAATRVAAGDTVTVNLRAGTYREQLAFATGGAPGRPLTVRAYRPSGGVPENVSISALDVITGWTLDSGTTYRAPMDWELVSSGDTDDAQRGLPRHQVFADGEMLVHARWPNIPVAKASSFTRDDTALMDSGSGRYDAPTYVNNSQAWFTDTEVPAGILALAPGALINYLPSTMCFSRTARVTAYDVGTGRLTLTAERLLASNSNSTSDFGGQYDYPTAYNSYYLWGKRAFLDSPGEWFRERTGTGANESGTLYVIMPDGQNPGTRVEARRRKYITQIGSTSLGGTPGDIDDITFEDLRFLGAGITADRGTDRLTIRRCTFRYSAHTEDQRLNNYILRWDRRALIINGTDSLVESCDFNDLEVGIELNGRNNTVRDCTFYRIGAYTLGSAVTTILNSESATNDGSAAQRNLVERSTFLDSAYTAIQVAKGLNIRYNEVIGTHRRGADTGAVSSSPGTDGYNAEIAYNIVRDSWPMPRIGGTELYGSFGIYFDRDSCNSLVHHNIVRGFTNDELALLSTSSGATDSGRIADHNTIDGTIGIEANGRTVTLRNNLSSNTLTATSGVVLSGNLGYAPGVAGWRDSATLDYRLLNTSRAIDTGLSIAGSPYGAFSNAAPDSGAYEGTAAWPLQVGAVAGPDQLSTLVATITPTPDGTQATVSITGLPLARSFPATANLRLGTAATASTFTQQIDAATGLVTATWTHVPAPTAGGLQTLSIALDGTTNWLGLGTFNTDGTRILSLTTDSTAGLDASTGGTVLINGANFAPPILPTWETALTIANPAATALFDFPVLVTFDSAAAIAAARLQTDGRDLRFRSADGTDLPYWIESGLGTSTTRVWVRLAAIPAGGTTATLITGDTTLSPASSGTDVFSFFDAFSDGNGDTAGLAGRWSGYGAQNGTSGTTANAGQEGGALVIRGETTTIDYGAFWGVNLPNQDPLFYPRGPRMIEARVSVRLTNLSDVTLAGSPGWKAILGGGNGSLNINAGKYGYYSGTWIYPNNATTALTNTGNTVLVGMAVVPTTSDEATGNLLHFENGVLLDSYSARQLINQWGNPVNQGSWAINPQTTGRFILTLDDVRVRPWVASEPVATLGATTALPGNPLSATFEGIPVTAITWIRNTQLQVTLPAQTGTIPRDGALVVTTSGRTLPPVTLHLASTLELIPASKATWPFDGSLTAAPTTYNGTAVGTLSYASGQAGTQALSLDGTNRVSTPYVLNPTTNFTVTVWVRPTVTNPTDTQTILQQADGSGTGRGWLYRKITGELATFLGNAETASTGTVPLNTWTHVALVNTNGVLQLYLNGVADGSASRTIETCVGTMLIGAHKSITTKNWTGQIDDLRLYSSALNGTQVTALYTENAPAAPSNLAAVAVSPSQINLTWLDNASTETGFELERSLNGTTGWSQIGTPAANAASISDTGLTAGTTYYYRLRATNPVGDSANTSTASATTYTGLQSFRTAHGLAADGSQDLLTPAGDGVANLLKYAFNMIGTGAGQGSTLTTPNASVLAPAGTAGLPFASIESGTGKLQMTYLRRKSASTPGISYAVQFSNDLGVSDPWAVNGSATESVTPLDSTFERVTVTDTALSPAKRFARVRVATP